MLRTQNEDERAWRETLAASLPVPVLVTDLDGAVSRCNAAAAFVLGIDRRQLAGTSLLAHIEADERAELLRQVSSLTHDRPQLRRVVTLAPLRRASSPTSMVVTREPGRNAGRLRWVLIPASRPASGVPQERGLAAATAFAELCRLPADFGDDLQAVLSRVATLGREAVPAAHALSVSLGDPAAPDMLATESVFAQAVDGAQVRAGEGPCPMRGADARPVLSDDVVHDLRWPGLRALAESAGARAVLSVPIHGSQEVLGVLNLYGGTVSVFDDESQEIAELLSVAVGAVVDESRDRRALAEVARQMQEAMESRAVIEQAKGILMALHGLTVDDAFRRLVTVSRNSNTKVRDLAARLVADSVPSERD